jgi:hypothetical protein
MARVHEKYMVYWLYVNQGLSRKCSLFSGDDLTPCHSWNQGCHTGRQEAFWRANRVGGRAALSITPYMNRVGYCRQRNYCSKFTLLQ